MGGVRYQRANYLVDDILGGFTWTGDVGLAAGRSVWSHGSFELRVIANAVVDGDHRRETMVGATELQAAGMEGATGPLTVQHDAPTLRLPLGTEVRVQPQWGHLAIGAAVDPCIGLSSRSVHVWAPYAYYPTDSADSFTLFLTGAELAARPSLHFWLRLGARTGLDS